MKTLGEYLLFGMIFVGLFSVTALAQTSSAATAEKDKVEAQRLWDEVIRMKGGRDRLRNVHSLLVTSSDRNTPYWSELYVFPDKYWEWIKDTPRPRGTAPMPSTTVRNDDLAFCFWLDGNFLVKCKPEDTSYTVQENGFLLLETASQPFEPVRVTRGRFDKQVVEIIETRFHKHRIDFSVEAESLMVLKVSDYGADWEKDPETVEYVFKDYVDIDGIKMPLSKGWLEFGKTKLDGSWVHYSYEFNVNYDPDIFLHAPSAHSFDGWKRRSKS